MRGVSTADSDCVSRPRCSPAGLVKTAPGRRWRSSSCASTSVDAQLELATNNDSPHPERECHWIPSPKKCGRSEGGQRVKKSASAKESCFAGMSVPCAVCCVPKPHSFTKRESNCSRSAPATESYSPEVRRRRRFPCRSWRRSIAPKWPSGPSCWECSVQDWRLWPGRIAFLRAAFSGCGTVCQKGPEKFPSYLSTKAPRLSPSRC